MISRDRLAEIENRYGEGLYCYICDYAGPCIERNNHFPMRRYDVEWLIKELKEAQYILKDLCTTHSWTLGSDGTPECATCKKVKND